MRKIHLILTGLSLTILLLSLNRLASFTQGYLQPHDFLRWLDFNAMLPIPLISIVLYYLLKRQIVYDSPFRKSRWYVALAILFISGIYLFGAGSGDHEVTNYLNTRFCDRGAIHSTLCNIISYNDDAFGHLVYYAGFIAINSSLILMEYNMPHKRQVRRRDLGLISLNGLFIGLGIFANLAFEEIGLDLVFFGSIMLLALYLLFLTKRKITELPVTYYFGFAYTFGVLTTLLYTHLL